MFDAISVPQNKPPKSLYFLGSWRFKSLVLALLKTNFVSYVPIFEHSSEFSMRDSISISTGYRLLTVPSGPTSDFMLLLICPSSNCPPIFFE